MSDLCEITDIADFIKQEFCKIFADIKRCNRKSNFNEIQYYIYIDSTHTKHVIKVKQYDFGNMIFDNQKFTVLVNTDHKHTIKCNNVPTDFKYTHDIRFRLGICGAYSYMRKYIITYIGKFNRIYFGIHSYNNNIKDLHNYVEYLYQLIKHIRNEYALALGYDCGFRITVISQCLVLGC